MLDSDATEAIEIERRGMTVQDASKSCRRKCGDKISKFIQSFNAIATKGVMGIVQQCK
jgi:hypothetical protein